MPRRDGGVPRALRGCGMPHAAGVAIPFRVGRRGIGGIKMSKSESARGRQGCLRRADEIRECAMPRLHFFEQRTIRAPIWL